MEHVVFKEYCDAKVLLTGGSGFIGGMLCEQLVQYGAEIHAVSRHARPGTANVTWWKGDLADDQFVRELFDRVRPHIVFHLASEVTGSRDLDAVLPTLNANLVSTVNILVTSTHAGCSRVVMAGSLEEPDEEDGMPVPCSPYAAAKWAGAGYARMFHALYKTPVTLARLFMVYGPGQQDLRKLVPYVTLSLLQGDSPKLSSGQRPVDWIYVEDVVRGLLMMGKVPGINGLTIELGSGELVTTRRVVEMLSETVAAGGVQPQFGALPDRPMERIRTANTRASDEVLGWQPHVGLKEGLARTVDWYKARYKAGEMSLQQR